MELGAFLRARRGAIRPDSAGLPAPEARRQVAGMRREEVAELAFVSLEHYTRIEQGRVPPSKDVLDRLSSVLRFTEDEDRYARQLLAGAGFRPSPAPALPEAGGPIMRLLRRLVDIPAVVIGPQTAILAWNDAAARLFLDFAQIPVAERTFVELLFTNELFQSRFGDLPAMQRLVVGILRSTSTDELSGDMYSEHLQRLLGTGTDFHAIWHQFDVSQPHGIPALPLHHPETGDIVVDEITLLFDDPSQRLLLFVQ